MAKANDRLLYWLITRRPLGQTAVDCFVLLNNFVLPRMRSVQAEREGGDQPDRCVLALDNTRIHIEVALASLRAACVVVLLLPPYSPDINPIDVWFWAGSGWLRRFSCPGQYNAWTMLTIYFMLEHITGEMCRGFWSAAIRRYSMYVP